MKFLKTVKKLITKNATIVSFLKSLELIKPLDISISND